MYSTCLFCHQGLGANESVEHFPVGRRLAFDAAKGRLWVVCRKCERWNLTPLEERWEAIEECERLFSASKLRVSTEQVGLARLKDGTELVRIGAPLRPEMAAWRYGDQFGRRRRKRVVMVSAGAAIAGGVLIGGPMLGLIGAGAISPMLNVLSTGSSLYRARTIVHVPTPGGDVRVRLSNVPATKLYAQGSGILLRLAAVADHRAHPWRLRSDKTDVDLTGDDAVRALGALLPRMNAGGGSARDVSRAVEHLEATPDPIRQLRRAVDEIETPKRLFMTDTNFLKNVPQDMRLALEMAVHEESERRALEGELHVLEEAWRSAEEIAGIADDMFLPASMDDELARLKKLREERDKPVG